MSKIMYKSGNYVVVTDSKNVQRVFPISKTVYDETAGNFLISEGQVEREQLLIPVSDAVNWVDNDGTNYTIETFRDFLRTNTGCIPSAGGGGGGGSTPIGATLMKTNQTVSYRQGDDGDLEAGRETDFFTLASQNPFNTLERFTDELGGQTYTNKIIIDWSTYDGTNVLGYADLLSSDTWANMISNCNSHTVGTYTSGWRLANIRELYNISNYGVWPHTYTPINIFNGGAWMSFIWASTSYPYSPTTQACAYNWNYVNLFGRSKTSSYPGMPVRNFTVNGTTLS